MGVEYHLIILVNALLFAVGAVPIIQTTMFNEYTLFTLILAYIFMKLIAFATVKFLVYAGKKIIT